MVCHNEADFPGHADVNDGKQDDFATDFSGESSSDLSPGSTPIYYKYQDKHDINYEFEARWVDGCETETRKQSFKYPLGLASQNTAQLLVRECYTKCRRLIFLICCTRLPSSF